MNITTFILAAMTLLAPKRDHAELGKAIAAVVESEEPLFKDDAGKKRTAAFVVAVAFRESSFRNDVVSKTNDHCAMQVHGRPELAKDAGACVKTAMTMLRESFKMCPVHPLAFYAEGPAGCASERAQRISRDRMALAKWIAANVKCDEAEALVRKEGAR